MKIFLSTDFSDERLRFAAQIGADGVSGAPTPGPHDKGYYDFLSLTSIKQKVESFGLDLATIRLVPWEWTFKWMLGLPGRDEQIENYQTTIRNVGAAGIGLLIYNMHVLRIYRTSQDAPERAGARATSFDASIVRDAPLMTSGAHGVDMSLVPEEHRKPVSDEQMWANLK
jgi:mannonate dehydratase